MLAGLGEEWGFADCFNTFHILLGCNGPKVTRPVHAELCYRASLCIQQHNMYVHGESVNQDLHVFWMELWGLSIHVNIHSL